MTFQRTSLLHCMRKQFNFFKKSKPVLLQAEKLYSQIELSFINQLVDLMGCTSSKGNQPHACCPPGSWPALQIEYSPIGKTVDLGGGFKVYEAGSGTKVLVIFEDIFGTESGKHKSIADTYANLGFKVYLPQFLDPPYNGSITDMKSLLECVGKQKMTTIKSRYEQLSAHIKTQGSDNILAAGLCWGAWAAFRMSADYNNIKAIASIHPSFIVEKYYGGSELSLVNACKCPTFFYSCSNDEIGTKKGGEYVKILSDKFGADKVGSQEFPDQQHGFLIRSDPKLESARRDTQKVIKLTLEYFAKFP